MKPKNPFILTGYYSPEYFCNRQEETERIINAVENRRNITLFSIRRLGKTGLIYHTFEKLKKKSSLQLYYFDILSTSNLNEFINVFATKVFGKLESKPEKFIKKIIEIFSGIRPVISFDPVSGLPNLQLNIKSDEEANKSLEKIFEYLNKSNKQILIAIDEFQQVTYYPEKNVEALLRTNIQKSKDINFIVSGSQKYILLSIFSEYGKPFYQSSEMMHLEKIDADEYSDFIISKFFDKKRKINKPAVNELLDKCRIHTYYVQFLCNRLFSLSDKNISKSLIVNTLNNILKENEPVYINYKNLLTNYQWKVLKAIAHEENSTALTSKNFVAKYNLGTPSSLQGAIAALLNKEMIYKEGEYYLVYDIFLERWLEKL